MSEASAKAVLQVMVLAASLEQRFSPVLGSVHGLSLNDFLLLLNVARAPLQRMRRADLAAAMSVGQSSISHMADPLEKMGLVSRQADQRDGRIVYVVLTATGQQTVTDAEATLGELSARLFDERWGSRDIETFVSRLAQLTYGSLGYLAK